MRKIEEAMASAILARKPWAKANTAVTIHPMPAIDGQSPGDVVRVWLHGNQIAEIDHYGSFVRARLDDCGWKTNTTKSRINAIADCLGIEGVKSVKGKWRWDQRNCKRPTKHGQLFIWSAIQTHTLETNNQEMAA
jgi:hypothetical protein